MNERTDRSRRPDRGERERIAGSSRAGAPKGGPAAAERMRRSQGPDASGPREAAV